MDDRPSEPPKKKRQRHKLPRFGARAAANAAGEFRESLKPGTRAEMFARGWAKHGDGLAAHPKTAAAMEDLRERFEKHGEALDVNHLVSATLDGLFELVREDFQDLWGRDATSAIAGTRVAAVDLDTPWAESQLAGSENLILFSEGLSNYMGLLLDCATALDRNLGNPSEAIATIAAMRHYFIQQAVFGLSATHGLHHAPRGRHHSWLSAHLFVLAHEAAHHTQGHVQMSQYSPEVELEADLIAAHALKSGIRTKVLTRSSRRRQAGAFVALLAVDSFARAMFVRAPDSHPDFASRLAVLRKAGILPQTFSQLETRLAAAAEVAADLGMFTSHAGWDALISSRQWDTSLRSAQSYKTTRVLDQIMSAPSAQLFEILVSEEMNETSVRAAETFGRSLQAAAPLKQRLANCGIDEMQASEICDESLPLSLGDLVQAFMSSTFWGDVEEPERAMTVAAAAAIVRNELR